MAQMAQAMTVAMARPAMKMTSQAAAAVPSTLLGFMGCLCLLNLAGTPNGDSYICHRPALNRIAQRDVSRYKSRRLCPVNAVVNMGADHAVAYRACDDVGRRPLPLLRCEVSHWPTSRPVTAPSDMRMYQM